MIPRYDIMLHSPCLPCHKICARIIVSNFFTFQAPKSAVKWDGIWDAKSPGNSCIQYDPIFVKKVYGTEDCLFINVYVPKVTQLVALPVMVFIHGGGFQGGDGSPNVVGPEYFMESGVILVTINYRVGLFGFMSLNTEDVPGNAGLKDQSFALKWVQENILNFGGDPNRVTIFGESSGSASVQYHILSPMSKGLFGGAIMESGSCLSPWSLDKHPEIIAQAVTTFLKMPKDTVDVGKFLRTIPEHDLLTAQTSQNIFVTPTLEKIFPNVIPFMTISPQEIMNSGQFNKVPTISGLNTYEGLIFRIKGFSFPDKENAIKNKQIPDVKHFVPVELIEKYGENGTDQIVDKIKEFYFPTPDNLSDNYTNLLSDYMIIKDTVISVKLFAKYSSPAFFYKFSYDGSKNFLRLIANLRYTGSAHTDELAYLFDVKLEGVDKIPLTQPDELITQQLLQMWTNFAKFR